MNTQSAYFTNANPSNKTGLQKYNFIFNLVYTNNIDFNIERGYRFSVRDDENISHLKDKIISAINTSYRIRLKTDNEEEETEKSNKKIIEKNNINFLCNNEKIFSNMPFKDFVCITDKLEFIIFDLKYDILINKPQILNLELPNTIFANCPLYPIFDASVINLNISIFQWFKSKDKENWELLANTYCYHPTTNDIGCYLKIKCIPKYENEVGPENEVVSKNTVRVFDLNCPFINRQKYTPLKLSGKSFRIISYNILSENYVKGKFTYCVEHALDIHYRKQLLLKELAGYNADIICIQEMNYWLLKQFLKKEMNDLGFKYNYEPKLNRGEGVSIFYRESRFMYERTKRCILAEEIEKNSSLKNFQSKIKQYKEVYERLLDQNTVLQILVLRSSNVNNNIIVIGNTHLYYHPTAKHIRILQSYICMHLLQNMCKQIKQKNQRSKISLVFCGDFNSQPQSGVFDLITNGMILADHEDWTKNEEEVVRNLSLQLNLSLISAYGKPQFTNYTDDFKACLDYIFYEQKCLKIKQIVPLLTEEEMKKETALPNSVVPSDHVALIVDFTFK